MLSRLRKKINKLTSHPLFSFAKRIFIIAIGLTIIFLFIRTQPDTATQLYQRAAVTLGLIPTPTVTPPSSPLPQINQARQDKNINALAPNSQLDTVAKLIALSFAATSDQNPESQIDIEQLAQIAGYDYSLISYLAVANPLPLIQPPETIWLEQSDSPIFNQELTQAGFYNLETNETEPQLLSVLVLASPQTSKTNPTTQKTKSSSSATPTPTSYYTGTQLWQEIQAYRRQHGVPEFQQDNVLCTIASIRVNQLLELGKLDDHNGFEPLINQYRDKGYLTHTNIAENILSGYPTASAAVAGWDSSLGHQALLKDGSYVYGCAAANSGFAVLIAAF